jgi:hypothetical protein
MIFHMFTITLSIPLMLKNGQDVRPDRWVGNSPKCGAGLIFGECPHNPGGRTPHNTKEHEEQAIVDVAWCYRYAFVCTHVTKCNTPRETLFCKFQAFQHMKRIIT